jgi:hypothetical protein
MNDVFVDLNTWFKANALSLNVDKTNYIKFASKIKICFSLNIGFDNKLIEKVKANTFLGIQIDTNLNFKKHTKYVISRLSCAYFAVRTVAPLKTLMTMTVDNIKLVCFTYFHFLLSHEWKVRREK